MRVRDRGDHGPLGQGIANAAGMAVAEAFLSRWLGPEIVDHHTYALVGDGCLQEGIGQEVISLAGHLRLGKLVFLWDDNRMTDDGVIDFAWATTCSGASGSAAGTSRRWTATTRRRSPPRSAGEEGSAALDDRLPDCYRARFYEGGGHAAAHSSRVLKEQTDAAREYLVGGTRRSWYPGTSCRPGGRPGGAASLTMRRGRPG